MNNSVFDLNQRFNFDILNLGNPTLANNNNYVSKLSHGITNKNLYIQLPKCTTKNGIIKNSSKTYTELNFCMSQKSVIDFFENLEKVCTEKIYNNKELWLYESSDMVKNDIDELMLSTMKPYKHGKNFLVKAYIKLDKLHIYDENENKIEIEDFDNTNEFIPLVNINNIKFSTKNFSIEIFLTQMMLILPSDEFEKQVLIKTDINKGLDISSKPNNESHNESPLPISDIYPVITSDLNLEEQPDTRADNNQQLEKQTINNDNNISLFTETTNTDNIPEINNSKNITPNLEETISNISNQESNLSKVISTSALVKETEQSNNNEFKYLMSDNLETVNVFDIPESETIENTIELKSHQLIYLEIYKKAKKKAKQIRKNAIAAFLEAKQIKYKYNLDDLDYDSSDDDEEDQDFLNLDT
tara:strand:+ start:1876 stop:3120 length:1245 start_codon:yes stop_codon:yes gene_type:complete